MLELGLEERVCDAQAVESAQLELSLAILIHPAHSELPKA